MNKVFVIGVSGPKGSGKDEYYQIANRRFTSDSVSVHKYAFADLTKKTIIDVCHLDGENQYDQLKRTENIKMIFGDHSVEFTGRDFVRDIGMAIRYANDQYFNQDVCKRIVTDIAKDNLAGKTTSICIVTDVRFLHSSKVLLPIVVTLLETITEVRPVQLLKA